MNSWMIRDLYPLALAEGEGVGTAYEYFAKRLLLLNWLAKKPAPRVLIAGLPEKYGASLDFLLLARELGGRTTIIDDRPQALQHLRTALTEASKDLPPGLEPQCILTNDLARMDELGPGYDLALSSEVLQRLPQANRAGYLGRLVALASQLAIFAPNADNKAHVGRSGLQAVRLANLETWLAEGLAAGRGDAAVSSLRTGYVDMPPFPPGITRSEDERERATTGLLEATAMRGLGWYAQLERFFPRSVRKAQSHIVYGLVRLSHR